MRRLSLLVLTVLFASSAPASVLYQAIDLPDLLPGQETTAGSTP